MRRLIPTRRSKIILGTTLAGGGPHGSGVPTPRRPAKSRHSSCDRRSASRAWMFHSNSMPRPP